MRTTLRLAPCLLALSLLSVAACAPVDGDAPESAAQSATKEGNWTQWFGTRDMATEHGPTLPADAEITQLDAYEDASFVYGLRIHWGDVVRMYGHTNNLSPNIFTPEGGVVRIDLHRTSGVLRGLKLYPAIGSPWFIGKMNLTPTTAFEAGPDTPGAHLRNLHTSSHPVTGVNVLCAMRFQY